MDRFLALIDIGAWALLTVPIYYLCRQMTIDRARWPIVLTTHLLGAGMFAMAQLSLSLLWRHASLEALFDDRFHWSMIVYWAIAAVCHAIVFAHTLERNQHRALELEARLAEAELQALKMQLQPHFLFNTLETISALMHQDVRAADRTLANLGDLLRYSLRHSHYVQLRDELAFIGRYLDIEQTRFPDRVRVGIHAEPALLGAQVPNLILQPLVENAVRHGGGSIQIQATKHAGGLRIEVSDDGPGLPSKLTEGIGLSNTRRRLEQLYGASGSFEIRNRAEGGLVAAISLPLA